MNKQTSLLDLLFKPKYLTGKTTWNDALFRENDNQKWARYTIYKFRKSILCRTYVDYEMFRTNKPKT